MASKLDRSFWLHPPTMISTIAVKLTNEIIISLNIPELPWVELILYYTFVHVAGIPRPKIIVGSQK